MRNKFDYSCSIKIHALGFDKFFESIFFLLLVVEVLSLQKVVKMLEEVILGWREVRWIWWMRQNFVAQFVQLLKHWLCEERLDFVMEKNWALSVDQCQLQALHFSVHLISLLNILLKYDNTKIQKVAADQAGSRPPNSDHDLIWCKFDFGKCFGASFPSNHWAGCPQLLYTIHFVSHFNPIEKMVLFVA